MKIYIPHTHFSISDKRHLFILTRPFFHEKGWGNGFVFQDRVYTCFDRVNEIEEADVILLPFPVNYYASQGKVNDLLLINQKCQKKSKRAFTYIQGDFGIAYPEFSNITYFRMGGFRSQLSENNKGFPVGLSDHFQGIYKQESISPLAKRELAVVGFCGHATTSVSKRLKELAKCMKENGRRLFQNPFRKDWEPLFASAYERAKLLGYLEDSSLLKTNFIYRNQYRAGAQSEAERNRTTLAYFDNISASDYVLCVRGAGNFSVRFYETLMMGKIPVFVNTDCLLPFEDQVNWKDHVVWVEWKDRKKIAQIVSDFHRNLSNEAFIQLQLNNRKLWKETLSVRGMLEMMEKHLVSRISTPLDVTRSM
ncbi:exostosin domain-containing protein [Flavobacterium maritimum]|uniref:exostosin domain-containing protein n=1 Tax=Flavobacterium maritimum TaxID=3149042 RepID=UPI0032B5D4E7